MKCQIVIRIILQIKKKPIIYNQNNKTITNTTNHSTINSSNSINHAHKFLVNPLCKELITDSFTL